MKQLVIAAIEGDPLPKTLFPFDPTPNPRRLLRKPFQVENGHPVDLPIPPASELDFRVFTAEIQVVSAPSPSAPPGEIEPGFGPAYEATVVLSSAGLSLGGLNGDLIARVIPETSRLAGVASLARQIHQSLCEDGIRELMVKEEQRSAFENDALFDRVLQRRPTPSEVHEIQQGHCGKPLFGFSFDNLTLVANSKSGGTYGFELAVRVTDNGPVIDAQSFVLTVYKI